MPRQLWKGAIQFGLVHVPVSLYPAGYFTRQIPVQASLTLPAGWRAATALRPTGSEGGRIDYGTVSYEVLQDSPVFAGKYFRADDLGHGVTLNTVADEAKELAVPADVLAKHRALVDQAHQTCPYSKALKGNIPIELSLA